MLLIQVPGQQGDKHLIVGMEADDIDRLRNNAVVSGTFRQAGYDMEGKVLVMYAPLQEEIIDDFRQKGIEVRHTVNPRYDQYRAIRRDYRHCLICTVGLPRAGKTTWSMTQGFPVVSTDAIRMAIVGQRDQQFPQVERMVYLHAHLMVESLFAVGHPVVILDACNSTVAKRNEWKDSRWATLFRPFTTTHDVCQQRAIATNMPYLRPVIDKMYVQFENLTADELRWPL